MLRRRSPAVVPTVPRLDPKGPARSAVTRKAVVYGCNTYLISWKGKRAMDRTHRPNPLNPYWSIKLMILRIMGHALACAPLSHCCYLPTICQFGSLEIVISASTYALKKRTKRQAHIRGSPGYVTRYLNNTRKLLATNTGVVNYQQPQPGRSAIKSLRPIAQEGGHVVAPANRR
jgi:hypothetical protein